MKTKNKLTNKFFKITPAQTIIIGFLGIILIGTFLLCLPISHTNGNWFSFIESLFTSTSMVCLTGLTTFNIATNLTLFGKIVILALIQIGGLGFVTLTCLIFMLIGKKINYSTRMSLQESLNAENAHGLMSIVKKIIIVTFSVEIVGAICLTPSIYNLSNNFANSCFDAIFLSVSAFCNAGVSVLNIDGCEISSLDIFATNPLILIVIMLMVVLGGIGFVVLFDLFNFKRETKKLQFHTKVVLSMSLILIFVGALLFAIFEWNNPNTIGNMSVPNKILNCLFQSIAPRSAGFSTFEQVGLNAVSKYITSIFMIIGGSPMSMAGGLKTTTIFVLFVTLIKNSLNDGSCNFKKVKISRKIITKSTKLLLIILSLIFVGSIAISLFEIGNTASFREILFETVSAITTVGLTMGITSVLSICSKITLTVLMFVGRVGMLTIPLAFTTTNHIENEIEFADSKIIVG